MSQDELRGLSENVGEVKVEADEIRPLTADLEAIVHRLPFRDAALSERLVRGLRQAGFDLADPPATGGWPANDGWLTRAFTPVRTAPHRDRWHRLVRRRAA